MTSLRGPTRAALGAIVLGAILCLGIVLLPPTASGRIPPTNPAAGVASGTGANAPGSGAAKPLPTPPTTSTLNESTLVLSNDSLVPGDYVPSTASLPSLEVYDPITDEVFVESFDSGVLDVLSGATHRVMATVATGAYPNTLAFDPVTNAVFFGLQTYDEVSLVNASTDLIERTVGIGFEPLAMAADPVTGTLFVTGWNATGTASGAVLSGATGVVLTTFSFGANRFPIAGPNGIVYDPANGDFYIPSIVGGAIGTRGNLTLVDAANATVLGTIGLRFDPASILYAPATGMLYLGNASGPDLREFNPVTGHAVLTVSLPNIPTILAYDPTSDDLFAGLPGNVTVVDTLSNGVVTTFPVSRNPSGLVVDPRRDALFVADYTGNSVSVFNASTDVAVGSALLGTSPYNIAFDGANGDYYIGDLESSQLIVVSGRTNRVVGFVPLGTTPYGIAYDPQTADLYVDDYYAGNVSIVSGATNSVIGYLPAGVEPWGIAYDVANHDLYVTNPGSDNLTVLNPLTRTVVTSLNFTTPPGAIAYDPISKDLFVGEYNVGNVSVLNGRTNALVRNASTGSEVYTIAVDSANGWAFVGNYGSDNVTVLGPTGKELGISAPAGVGVFGSVYDPVDGVVYVVSFDSDLVTAINGSTGVEMGGYTVGTGPVAAGVDPHSGTVVVANYDSDSLSLLSPTFRVATYPVTFKEKGLPAGTDWSVELDGVARSGPTRTLTYEEANGTGQPYSVAPLPGYTVSLQYGSVRVNGHAVTVTIDFAGPIATYPVTFTESGLATGVTWSVTFDGVTNFTTGTVLRFEAVDGTYAFVAGQVDGFSTNASGNLTVAGSPVSVTLTFVKSSYFGPFQGIATPPVHGNRVSQGATSGGIRSAEPSARGR